MLGDPKVTVALVVDDGHDHLGRAIDSVLQQTSGGIELVVVYIGTSEDGPVRTILEPYSGNVSYHNKSAQSTAAALNFAVKKATGTHFAWLSHEDIYMPNAIERLLHAAGDSECVVVADWVLVNRNDRVVRPYTVDSLIQTQPSAYLALSKDAQLNTSAMLFPTQLLRRKRFNESFPSARDYQLLNGLMTNGVSFRVVNESLLRYSSVSEDKYSSSPTISTDYDIVHSNLIGTLTYDALLEYFGSTDEATKHYQRFLEAGRPRCAAFLLQKIVAGLLEKQDLEAAKAVVQTYLVAQEAVGELSNLDELLQRISYPSSKKKLLFSSGHWLTGGMERVMSTLFRELGDTYEIYVITPYDSRESHISIPDHVVHIKISEDSFQKHFDIQIVAYSLLLGIDVLVGFINLFEKQLNAYRLCVGTDVKTIASNHEYYFYPYKSPVHLRVVGSRLDAFSHCNAIVWPNNFNAALCGLYVKNSYVIGNPNNFEVSPTPAYTSRDKVIISVGRFNDYVKRIDRILHCFALVVKKAPDARLVLVGKYDEAAPIGPHTKTTIRDLMFTLKIPEGSVTFVGETDKTPDFYSLARVHLLTSNSEGFGMVLNEAACFGVPSVCNYIPGLEDIISDGFNGYITDQDDIPSMADRVLRILEDKALATQLSKNAMEAVGRYDHRHIGDKWRLLLDTLIKDEQHKVDDRLQREIGYTSPDAAVMTRVLADELNASFHAALQDQKMYSDSKAVLMLSKLTRLPVRLKENIAYEGLPKTVHKVATRSLRIAKMKLGK